MPSNVRGLMVTWLLLNGAGPGPLRIAVWQVSCDAVPGVYFYVSESEQHLPLAMGSVSPELTAFLGVGFGNQV